MMKRVLFSLLVVLFCFAISIFAQGTNEPDKLIDTLKTQIEKARIEIDKKQKDERKKDELQRQQLKQEATRKYINDLYNESALYLHHKNYSKAKEIYQRLLALDLKAKPELDNRIVFCLAQIKNLEERRIQELDKKKQLAQLSLAKQIADEIESRERREKEKTLLLKTTQIKQHLSLGNEYLANKNYSTAIDEFEKVLSLEPTHKEAIGKLAKAKTFLLKTAPETFEGTASTKQGLDFYNQLIKDGFGNALKSLEANNYQGAQEEFSKILENINKLSIESAQLKTARQIKESAQKGPDEILSFIRSDKFDDAKKKLWELIQKTSTLSREKEEREKQEKSRLLIRSYLKNTSEYLEKNEYENAKVELQKVISLEPGNEEANTLLDRLVDIINITKESR
ncbi:MAG: tetratricopeptide repeat protein [Candidatus Omnitrophota bacterium]|nr:tetratricopeptide repeat protein [Candidatus Omnitrophota bacterium]